MQRFAGGDDSSFLLLFERYKDRIYRYVKRMCAGDSAPVEELFQDIWEKLIRHRDRFDEHRKFAPYIFSIAHNRLVDHFRSTAMASFEQYRDDAAPPDPVPVEKQVFSREQVERFRQVFDTLSAPQREIFVLREETSMTLSEIAEAVGVKPETAKSRLRFALLNLRKGMEGYA